jgi:hypothetical protein
MLEGGIGFFKHQSFFPYLCANKKVGILGGFSLDSWGQAGVFVAIREVHFDRRPSRQMRGRREPAGV